MFGRKAQVTDITKTWDEELYYAIEAGRIVPETFALKAWYEGIKSVGGYEEARFQFGR